MARKNFPLTGRNLRQNQTHVRQTSAETVMGLEREGGADRVKDGVTVCPALSVKGVDFILSNDLAGGFRAGSCC